MRYSDTAVFSDLDGTLFNSDSRISERNLAAIRAYTEQGGLFAIATGRSFLNSVYYMRTFVPEAPSVILNGSAVFDPASQSCPYQVEVDHEAVLDVLLWCRKNFPDMDVQAYGERETFYLTSKEKATGKLVEQLQPCTFASIEEIQDLPWFKTMHYGTPEQMRALYGYLVSAGVLDKVSVVKAITGIPPYHEHIELVPKDVNKGTALDACRSIPCYKGRKLLAVGDYLNDLELLEHADYAFCPSNACEEVKSASHCILASNDEDAIADLIGRVIPALE